MCWILFVNYQILILCDQSLDFRNVENLVLKIRSALSIIFFVSWMSLYYQINLMVFNQLFSRLNQITDFAWQTTRLVNFTNRRLSIHQVHQRGLQEKNQFFGRTIWASINSNMHLRHSFFYKYQFLNHIIFLYEYIIFVSFFLYFWFHNWLQSFWLKSTPSHDFENKT